MTATFSLKRIAIAVVIAAAIYGIAVGIGSLLYATDAIATGATHNDCPDFRQEIADEMGIDEEDVEQSDIKVRAQECLAEHELTEEDAFREEYIIWPAWPAVICAIIFLLWPLWSRILINHEEEENEEGAGHR
jgi:hypothetical protein